MRTKLLVAALAAAALAGCGGGGSDSTSDSGSSDKSDACLAEMKRQMSTGDETDGVPPQCSGLSDARLAELAKIAIADGFLGTPSASPGASK